MSFYKCTSCFLIMFKFDNLYLFGPNNCTEAIYKINLWKDKILTEREINLQHENTLFNFGPFKNYAYQNAVYFWSLISEYNGNQAIFICFLFIFSILKIQVTRTGEIISEVARIRDIIPEVARIGEIILIIWFLNIVQDFD